MARDFGMPSMGVFLLGILTTSVLSSYKLTNALPESAITVFVSIMLGLLARILINSGEIDQQSFSVMCSVLLNVFFLPIILFNGGWKISRDDFLRELGYVMIFTVLGTIISTVTIAYLAWFLTPVLGYSLSLRECSIFAALISAIDPVATLSSYGKLDIARRQPLLNTIVFGEAGTNDAVAIVIFYTINESPLEELDFTQVRSKVVDLFLFSLVFGTGLAMLLVLGIRAARLKEKVKLITVYCVASAYFIFTMAEALKLSGIIASLFAGMVFNLYGGQHLTEPQLEFATEFLEANAHFAEDCIFMMCGTATAIMNTYRGLGLGFVAVLCCLVGRLVSVVICGSLSNGIKRISGDGRLITWRHQVMMVHGGLRGGIALVLALVISTEWCANKDILIEATFFVIVALLLLCGSTTEIMLAKLGMTRAAVEEPHPSPHLFHVIVMHPHANINAVMVGPQGGRQEADEERGTELSSRAGRSLSEAASEARG
jgi:NhaP-type Na+/H+ or K+/H+ antiporter